MIGFPFLFALMIGWTGPGLTREQDRALTAKIKAGCARTARIKAATGKRYPTAAEFEEAERRLGLG